MYSDPDRGAPHVRAADEAYPLGGTSAAESYLRGDRIIEIAKRCSGEALVGGLGLLGVLGVLAVAWGDVDIVFIGPPPAAMRP